MVHVPGEDLPQDDAEGKHISLGGVSLSAHDLGSDVRGGATHRLYIHSHKVTGGIGDTG